MKNKQGFTLIEVIIVIVILGVLATLALPRITGQIEASKAAEAVSMLGALRRAALQCWDMGEDIALCDTFAELGIQAPGASAVFTYTSATTGTDDVIFKATSTTATNSDAICLVMDASAQTVSYSVTPAQNIYAGTVSKAGTFSAAAADVAACAAVAGAM